MSTKTTREKYWELLERINEKLNGYCSEYHSMNCTECNEYDELIVVTNALLEEARQEAREEMKEKIRQNITEEAKILSDTIDTDKDSANLVKVFHRKVEMKRINDFIQSLN